MEYTSGVMATPADPEPNPDPATTHWGKLQDTDPDLESV